MVYTVGMTNCTGTDYLTDLALVQSHLSYPVEMMYGRKMCATCLGVVLLTSKGTLRKHKAGSNR